jgi:hypothetical protein
MCADLVKRSTSRTLAPHPPRVPGWVATATYVLVPIAAVTLLVLHTVTDSSVHVDTTTLGLLALLLLVPLAPHITRLKAGGLEAEIGPRDAQQLQASAVDLPVATADASATSSDAPAIGDLIVRDPPLGLAKLRIEIEDELRRLCAVHVPEATLRKLPPGIMVRELRVRGVLQGDVATPLIDVITLANRAVHGEYVPSRVASDIADVGLRVLSALRQIT